MLLCVVQMCRLYYAYRHVIERHYIMINYIHVALFIIPYQLNGKGSTFEPKQLMMELTATGIKRQQNSLVYYCPPSPNQHVVFFQGDTQVCPQSNKCSKFVDKLFFPKIIISQ